MQGYYTDAKGTVLGYWDLDAKPLDTDKHTWVATDDLPPMPPPSQPADDLSIVRRDALNALIEEKIDKTPELKARMDGLK
jgi:hypothetical protein